MLVVVGHIPDQQLSWGVTASRGGGGGGGVVVVVDHRETLIPLIHMPVTQTLLES